MNYWGGGIFISNSKKCRVLIAFECHPFRETEEDHVREPIPVRYDQILEPRGRMGSSLRAGFNPRAARSVFDGFRDLRNEQAILKQQRKELCSVSVLYALTKSLLKGFLHTYLIMSSYREKYRTERRETNFP